MWRQKPAGKTIGEVERLIPKRTIKYYVERGILVPDCKSVSGYWLYRGSAAHRRAGALPGPHRAHESKTLENGG